MATNNSTKQAMLGDQQVRNIQKKNMQKICKICSLCKSCHQYAKYAQGTLLLTFMLFRDTSIAEYRFVSLFSVTVNNFDTGFY